MIFDDESQFGRVESYSKSVKDFDEEFKAINLTHLPEQQRSELYNVLVKHRDVFSDKPRCCNTAYHEINLVEGF